ncbi:exodeoxyribonuclease VII large subunit [Thermotomaculum hydrothermale]|uniref:Exodeoxyribonuclease 7 large subunit n=1 Tax=Thermotomaculum hydrothermale TaxID=981385 RepID=A0A7R6PXE1_9BACT|nr:exodeoxyribonuclease VII large subunit [Thermotomaculum hydrothermale]BBB32450.1 exodeoxyribonuclease VII large subunit [Thermotomaculum hydrothermale]
MFENVSKRIKKYFTVSNLTKIIKQRLTTPDLQQIWVLGEITDLKYFTRGKHAYFSLKDENAVISCAFFAGNNRFYSGNLENGMKVFAFGDIDVYAPRGNYQLIVRQIVPAGEGEFALKIKALEEKFKKEGLFDRKRPVPELPETIGLITSKDGAAIKDFLKMAKEVPYLKIILYPSLVQGEDAPATIIEGIKRLNKIDEVEAIVITRGGGSEEDLRCFYDENLVRAIFNSKKPVISAIGHERDVVFTDRVADLRKATPTDAGKFFAESYKKTFQNFKKLTVLLERKMRMWVERNPDEEKIRAFVLRLKSLSESVINSRQQHIDYLNEKLLREIEQVLNDTEQMVKTLSIKIHPRTLLSNFETRVERLFNLEFSLENRLEKIIERKHAKLTENKNKLKVNINENFRLTENRVKALRHRLNPFVFIKDTEKKKEKVEYLKKSLYSNSLAKLKDKEGLIKMFSEKLNDLSPLNVVSRGYAIVKDKEGNILKSANKVNKGDFIEVNLKDGSLDCTVNEINIKER